MGKGILICIITLFTTIETTYAQDYYPLQLGNKWEYLDIFNDQTYTYEVIKVDTLTTPPRLILHTMEIDSDGEKSEFIFYSVLSNPNNIFLSFSPESALRLQCSFGFKHSYMEGDIIPCQNGLIDSAIYSGTYITQEGLVFEECWTVQQAFTETEAFQAFVVAPNIGLIANYFVGSEDIGSEILSHNLILNNADELRDYQIDIYPNPVQDVLNFTDLNDLKPDRVYIYNIQGKVIMYQDKFENQRIITSSLKSGQYFMIAQKDNRFIWKKSFIKV